jgi:hypothetical protein
METIFISIASYRDPELLPTLRDLLATAKNHNHHALFGLFTTFTVGDFFAKTFFTGIFLFEIFAIKFFKK